MNIVRWNPVKELFDVEREFNKLFRSFGNRFNPLDRNDASSDGYDNAVWMPLSDISEDKDRYVINADLPGVTKSDLKLSIKDGTLSISGERKQEKEERNKQYHRVERTFGKYFRSFSLPDGILSDKIEANFKDGQLEILIPKAEEVKPKEIEIKVK